MAAASIRRGRWHTNTREMSEAHQHEAHTSHTQAMAIRAHTEAIVVIEAVFQAPMFWLNAAAFINACGPSHTLSKSPRRMSPEPRRGQSSALCTQRLVGRVRAERCCWRSTIEMRRNCGSG
jgi:hypothetical protein